MARSFKVENTKVINGVNFAICKKFNIRINDSSSFPASVYRDGKEIKYLEVVRLSSTLDTIWVGSFDIQINDVIVEGQSLPKYRKASSN